MRFRTTWTPTAVRQQPITQRMAMKMIIVSMSACSSDCISLTDACGKSDEEREDSEATSMSWGGGGEAPGGDGADDVVAGRSGAGTGATGRASRGPISGEGGNGGGDGGGRGSGDGVTGEIGNGGGMSGRGGAGGGVGGVGGDDGGGGATTIGTVVS